MQQFDRNTCIWMVPVSYMIKGNMDHGEKIKRFKQKIAMFAYDSLKLCNYITVMRLIQKRRNTEGS